MPTPHTLLAILTGAPVVACRFANVQQCLQPYCLWMTHASPPTYPFPPTPLEFIECPFWIAGPGSGKTTVMALRALYIIGILRQLSRKSKGFDDVVALTFSRRCAHVRCDNVCMTCRGAISQQVSGHV